MKKLKDLFEKFLFTVEEVEEVVEDKPEPVIEEIPVEKPAPVRKPKVEPVQKPIVRKRNNPVVEEEYEPSPMITLTKEIKTPVLGDEEPVKEKKEVKEEPAREKKIEPELPEIKEEKPVKKPAEKPAEPYTSSAIISPMFGKKEKEAKPVKKKRREIVMPDSELGEKKSILGTVFSPLYGDKKESDNIPHDEVAPEVASLGVQDFLGDRKAKQEPVEKKEPEAVEKKEPEAVEKKEPEAVEKKEPEVKPVEKVTPIREEVVKAEEPVEEAVIEDMKPVTMTAEELRKNSTVTPFGTNVKKDRINIHEAWGTEPKKEEKEVERYENISLFDLDDKM